MTQNNAMRTKDGWMRTVQCRLCGAVRRYDVPYCPVCEGPTGGTMPTAGHIKAYELKRARVRRFKGKIIEIQEYYV